jgi:carboxypeptidase Q
MPTHMTALRAALITISTISAIIPCAALAEASASDTAMRAALDQIREAGVKDQWAYGRLADLSDKIGPRISGSPQAEAAVQQIAAALRSSGLTVSLQPVKVPHWVRGEEQGEIIEYPGRPAGVTQSLHLTTLGGSVATGAQGVSAQVLVVHSFDELRAREGQARGKIVLFDVPFNETLAQNGRAGSAYGVGVAYRVRGASAAAEVGAVAALIRSVEGPTTGCRTPA